MVQLLEYPIPLNYLEILRCHLQYSRLLSATKHLDIISLAFEGTKHLSQHIQRTNTMLRKPGQNDGVIRKVHTSTRRKTQESPDDSVRKLQRLPSNKKCADCTAKVSIRFVLYCSIAADFFHLRYLGSRLPFLHINILTFDLGEYSTLASLSR